MLAAGVAGVSGTCCLHCTNRDLVILHRLLDNAKNHHCCQRMLHNICRNTASGAGTCLGWMAGLAAEAAPEGLAASWGWGSRRGVAHGVVGCGKAGLAGLSLGVV